MIKANVFMRSLLGGLRNVRPVQLLMAMLSLTVSGCQFAPSLSSSGWSWSKKAPVVPDRILTVWSDSVLHQQGLPGVRGFGGRVYFYQAPSTDPIEIDGGVAVYVFDANQLDPKDQKPIRKYVFTADQLSEHMSKSSLGPSYSLWLPWDEVGGESRRLSLITRFEGREGGTVISDPSIKLLPGVPKSTDDQSPGYNSTAVSARMVGHQQHSREAVVKPEQVLGGRSVATIDLPPSFQHHLRGSAEFKGLDSTTANMQELTPTGMPQSTSSAPASRQSSNNPSASTTPFLSPPAPAAQTDMPTGATVLQPSGTATRVTQVYDARTAGTGASFGPRRDIREGRSIPRPR